ncbi:MAG: nicotinate-nucleotide adenylyltransferase [Pseudomonadota bacterium]
MKGPDPVGLFGGSFNQPHEGHRALVLHAQRHLGLKRVRVLVSPQNPLKSAQTYAPLNDRLAATTALMRGLKGVSVEPEARRGPVFAAETVRQMINRSKGAPLIYLVGADSFAGFHKWHRWRSILESLPIAVINRPGCRLSALKSPAAMLYAHARVSERQALRLAGLQAPAWCYLNGLNKPISSSEIRLNQNSF